MAKFVGALLAVAIVVYRVEADSFLAQSAVSSQVSKQDIEDTLLAELRGAADEEHLKVIEEELAPMFAALPKHAIGKVDHTTARYALNRYFVRKHAWIIKGLGGATDESITSNETSVNKAGAVSYIEKMIGAQDFGLHELVVFAATLTHLVQNEAMGTMSDIFSLLQLPLAGSIPVEASEFAIKAYIIALLTGKSCSAKTKRDFQALEGELAEYFPNWPEIVMFASDLRISEDRLEKPRRNPFVPRLASFDDASSYAQTFGRKFGVFQNLECRQIKSLLVDMEIEGSGRVPLAKFYHDFTHGTGDYKFAESVKYLRELGALDESNAQHPSVVISNYITGASNCLTTASFYAACCTNECESMFGLIEREVGAEAGTPAQIAQIVSNMASDTVDAPRNLSASLMSRLHGISEYHSGKVPVHGRLFAQWMHHAYPRECPFPHAAGSTNPLTPEEWAETQPILATHDEVGVFSMSDVDEVASLPWTDLEERIVGHFHRVAPAASRGYARIVMALAALLSFAATLVRATGETMADKATAGNDGRSERSFV